MTILKIKLQCLFGFLQHLVVVLVVVVVVTVDSRLYGKVPGAQLVAHVKQPSKCSGSNF